ncbi:MAG: secretin N-terminal domain-containing protein [Gammaproteobacteria bacterium]|nr:secretin N-terminal domain-containing protein [Gammaproteobacteria bacterium]
MKKTLTLVTTLSFLLVACSSTPDKEFAADFPRFHPKENVNTYKSDKPLPLFNRLSWPLQRDELPVQTSEKLYSFVAKKMPVRRAINLFAKSYDLNILLDNDVNGEINVSFKDLPFNQAMTSILSSLGYYWEKENNLITVKLWETRQFTINYIRLSRSGSGSSEAQVSSGGGDEGGGDGGGSDSQAGTISIEQENKIEFWDEIDVQLKNLVSEKGRLVINRMSGTIQLTDQHARVEEMAAYISEINSAVHRQVDIEVKIIEVLLNDDFSLGVDWSRMVNQGQPGKEVDFTISNIISSPVGTGAAIPSVLSLTASNTGNNGENNLTALITALEEQGEVQIVSQPHIRTLNNQSALIKVGTDRTFFRREQNTDNTTAGSNTTSTDVPQVVTEGIVLSITPQISSDGWVMMDISPVVTRVSSVVEVRDVNGLVQSSAPNLDIRQTSSLIRAFDGETVIIGGLIQTLEAETNRGVPGLNDIPIAGHLFNAQYNAVRKKELIIFLTPTIVNTDALFKS